MACAPRLPGLRRGLLLAWLALGALAAPALRAEIPARARVSFDDGWRFIKNDPDDVKNSLTYGELKDQLLADSASPDFVVRPPDAKAPGPGESVSYVQPGFDDSSWRQLNLPQDWGIEGPFDPSLPGATGRLSWSGVGWYRKTFKVLEADRDKRTFLDMDGAMAYASVWLNGHYLGGWPYGYSSFRVELTSAIKPGADNVLAIRLDNPPNSSRWYPGGGIYRNVWLVTTNPVHVAHWGVYVTTPNITDDDATVKVQVNVENQSGTAAADVAVHEQIFALGKNGQPTGPALASTEPATLSLDGNETKTVTLNLDLPNPKLWNLDDPNLYAAVTTVQQRGVDTDSMQTNFGVRTITFDPDNGFFLNGEHVKLNGVCDHSDLGPLGTVVNVRGLERQIQLLKEMGCNAIRTSHNMPSPELLDLCDRMGMLVMDESFDCWERGKTRNDYSLLFKDWHERDLRAEIRRDRNHPSVIMWSIGNEVSELGSPRGQEIAAELTGIAHEEDPTRPTTSANNNVDAGFNGFAANEDIFGYNYKPNDYFRFHVANPDQFLFGSETASTVSSRGVYTFPVADQPGAVTGGRGRGGNPPPGEDVQTHQVSSYDLYYPAWATSPDTEFSAQDRNPFVGGEFVWTGFDYLGEPTPFGTARDPSRSSYFGIIDLDGFKKDRFYLYQAHWRPDFPMAHILPHWNWAGREGQVTPVMVYTSGDEAELFLNGQSLGRKQKGEYDYRLRWDDVKYAPGELHVVAYKNGQVWAEDTVKTTGAAANVDLAPDRSTIANDGHDISYVTVSIKDKDGLTVPTANNKLHYEISGPGEIVAVDNGDPTSLAPMQGSSDSQAFNGLALVIVRAKSGQTGEIVLTATSDGLATASTTIVAGSSQ